MAKRIRIVEVGPRDGLQNEAAHLSIDDRCSLVVQLAKAGLNHIEVGAFVSPKWVPQMQGSAELVKKLFDMKSQKLIPSGIHLSALVPNQTGMDAATKTPLKEIAVFGACTESFSKKNINCTIEESFLRFADVLKVAKRQGIKVRGYLSTAFGCPYEGAVDPKIVVALTQRLLKMGVYEVSIGDTIGVATPKQVRSVLTKIKAKVPTKRIAMHFHDTRGTALANVLASLDLGVSVFDSSVGGLGGCPYAKGASGNLATEDLLYMLHGMGFATGVDLSKLIALRPWLQERVGHPLPSRVAQAGIPNSI